MSYKFSGTTSKDMCLYIIDIENGTIDLKQTISGTNSFNTDGMLGGNKIVVAYSSEEGQAQSYGNVAPILYVLPGDRAVTAGGATILNVIEYITISTPGNGVDFGDLTVGKQGGSATSNGSNNRGLFGGSNGTISNVIDYVTITITGNAADFGDLSVQGGYMSVYNHELDRSLFANTAGGIVYVTTSTTGNSTTFGNLTIARYTGAGCSNAVGDRGVFGAGRDGSVNYYNTIDYVTISTPSNALDFGDLDISTRENSAISNGSNNRAIWAGSSANPTNKISYKTISTLGNAVDFGDLLIGRRLLSAASNTVNQRGVFFGGVSTDFIDYITINTLGNSTSFGLLTSAKYSIMSTSNA